MDILDVCITGIVSEEELNRVVRVTIDTDCWGQTARVTGAFFKNDWERFKQRRRGAYRISRDLVMMNFTP